MSLSSTDWQSAIIFLLNSDCLEMWFKKHHKNKQAEKSQQNKNKLSYIFLKNPGTGALGNSLISMQNYLSTQLS